MAIVRDLLANKGSVVRAIAKDASVLEAALLMNEHKIGSLVVAEGDQVLGMFTERDVLRRVVGERREPSQTKVVEVMSSNVYCCTRETSVEEARSAMKTHRIRHLPVVDEHHRLVGLISIGDLNAYDLIDQEKTIHLMHEYLYGRV